MAADRLGILMLGLLATDSQLVVLGTPVGEMTEDAIEENDELLELTKEAARNYAASTGLNLVNPPKLSPKEKYINAWYYGPHPEDIERGHQWFKGIGWMRWNEISEMVTYIVSIGRISDDDRTICHFEYDLRTLPNEMIALAGRSLATHLASGYITMNQTGQYEIWRT